MKIRNYETEKMMELLYGLPLRGKESRMRTRFVNALGEHLNEIILKEQRGLLDDYAEKDENKNFIFLDEDKSSLKIKEGLVKEYQKEFLSLMNESLYIEENESNKEMLLTISELMIEGDFEVSGELAEMYDMWCERFEKTIERYKKLTE